MQPEFRNHRKHKYGALAAARQWENNPNKLSSPFEFYIVHKRSGAHHLDNEHTVFGEVVTDAENSLAKIESLGGMRGKTKEVIQIVKATIRVANTTDSNNK